MTFVPDLSATEEARRVAAVFQIIELTQKGYVDSQKDDITVGYLDDEDVLKALFAFLYGYSTETLEYTAVLRSSPDAPRPYLFRIFRDFEDWATATDIWTDWMFRDVVSLRRVTVPLSRWSANDMFSAYKATGIGIGRLHEIGMGRERDVAEALILASRTSRMAETKGLRNSYRTRLRSGVVPAKTLMNALDEANRREHLTDEWITYLTENPQHRSALADYLIDAAQPLSEVSPQYFEEYVSAHAAMKNGVL